MVVAVVAVVPAPTLEPVSLHFRQPWLLPVLLNPKKRHHSITHAQLTVRSLFDTAMQLLGPSKIWSGRKWPVASHKQCNEWNEEACQAAGAVAEAITVRIGPAVATFANNDGKEKAALAALVFEDWNGPTSSQRAARSD
jgi:hypothetical protein